ncbi:MAG: hypothetical protein WAK55_26470 [Xanthobacteraceae bacterium]
MYESDPWISGVLKFFNGSFGFVKGGDGVDAYLSERIVSKAGLDPSQLPDGKRVRFKVVPAEKLPRIVMIEVLR